MDPITTAQLGMSTTYATRDSEPAPTARPSSAVPIGRPIATMDPKASSRITIATARPRASPTPVGACSNAKYRSPPASIRSDVVVAEVVEGRLEAAPGRQATGRRARGTGSGSGRPGRRARRPARLRSPSTCGQRRQRLPGPGPTSARARRGVEEGLLGVARREDDVGAETHVGGSGLRQQLGGAVRVEPGRLERVVELATERRRGGDDHEADRAQVAITTQGRRAAKRPSRSSAPDTVASSVCGRRSGTPASASTVGAPGVAGTSASRPGCGRAFGRGRTRLSAGPGAPRLP